MQISDAFDAGNIAVRAIEGDRARLAIKPDPGEDGFFQWFYFRVAGATGRSIELVIENAGEASYLKGWEAYRACLSYDRETWTRAETHYADGRLTIRLDPVEADLVWLAYFAPYSRERHHDLIAACQTKPRCRHEVLGKTLDGEDLDLLTIGDPDPDRKGSGKKALWAIARQHPGESQAEWWMEGFLARLLDPDDPVSRALLERAVVYIVPNMNPDGSRRGHLRTNALGANLNREWDKPSLERSPEVYHTLAKMDATGVDVCLDVHGDEGLPYVFIAGGESAPAFDDRLEGLLAQFQAELARANPDFQTEHGYPKAARGSAKTLSTSTKQITERFGALAMTLEMPFKDNADAPDLRYGWSPARCRLIGRACVDALYRTLPSLDGDPAPEGG
ncbi:MAG: M14-type cytosolic carboxypeptidase [Marivibrio sp.]|uniref:M14 family metallopeptidase n=1 Tax=Marivibrio sp. TaxID=2039719 RepID=UPI0032EC4CAD